MKFWRLIDQVLDRFFVVLGAFVGSQIPEFMQQYTQRLAGHVDELSHLISNLREMASHSGKTLDQYINKFAFNADPDFSRQGEFMQGIVTRWQELSQALSHLMQSSFLERPYIFLKELNYPIGKAAFHSFQPGLNLTVEGLAYAGIGLLAGYLFYRLLSKFIEIGCGRAVSLFRQSI